MSKAGNETRVETSNATPAVPARSVVPSVIALSADLAESGISTWFDVLQEARSNLKSVADATIQYADTVTRGAFDLLRSVATRCDQLAAGGLERGKATALDVVAAARNTSSRAAAAAASLTVSTTKEIAGAEAARAA